MVKITDFEQVFTMSKHYGWYQFFVLFVIQYTCINQAGNFLFISFAGLKPKCEFPVTGTSICERISQCPANSTISIFHSLYEEEGFACPNNNNLPNHLQTLMSVASGIGALAGGHLADIYGRKWVAYSGLVGMIAFSMVAGLSSMWPVLALCMFAMGFSYGIAIDACMTLASETVGRKYRIVQTLAFQWSLAFQFISLIAYLSGSWNKYIIIVNACCLPILVLALFWVESPRWLIQQKRYQEAAAALNTMNKWNRCAVRFRAEQLVDINVGQQKINYSVWHLFSTKKLTLYSIVMIASAMTVEMTGIVILFNTQALAGSPFLNIALYGLLRIWVPAFVVLMEAKTDWFGRRTMFLGAQGITMTTFAIVITIYVLNLQEEWQVLMTYLALIGGVVNSSIFFTVYKQYVIELYPTVMRGMAIGAFGVLERVGGALAPQLLILNNLWSGAAFSGAILFVGTSFLLGAVILPETRNRSMPDSYKSAAKQDVNTIATQEGTKNELNHL